MANLHECMIGDRIETVRPCPLTGSHEAMVVANSDRHGNPLRNVMSLASGLIYVDPLPVEDLAKFYREDYRVSYKQTFVPKPKHILRAGGVALERHGHSRGTAQAGMCTLDIGAGGGEWVYLMKKLGCEARGIEPNLGYGSFAKDQYGVEVFLGMYQDAAFKEESFDLLSLYQVLEHLADPVEDLRRMSRFLKKGGVFLIEVPDILFAGMRFDHKWHEGHLFGFDALTLEAVAAKAGLRARFVEVLPGNLFGVFEKTGENSLQGPDLIGHSKAARAALQEGRDRYWTLSETYTKVPKRLVKRIGEKWVSSREKGPRAILDRVYKGL
ncbi:MAG: class I SAM-dependent methyltransferase [Verrucomicrobiae bacterium]|nr:class I SAM-dependent methyltransferase [Verrucomicrobiae bacterium]